MILFRVADKVRGKGRPRFTRSGHCFTPAETVAYEKKIRAAYLAEGGTMMAGPLEMRVAIVLGLPKKTDKFAGQWCEKRPDVDNVIKIVCDALNGVAYQDDSSVTVVSAWKTWGPADLLSVTLTEAERR